MKKTFLTLAAGIAIFSGVLMSCGGNNDEKAKQDSAAAAPVAEEETDPAIQEGLELIGKSDCLTCHKVSEQSVGPAYVAVAERYRGNPTAQDTLVHKVIHGGSGNWGPVAMTPHPALPEADVKKMITYIMSLKP